MQTAVAIGVQARVQFFDDALRFEAARDMRDTVETHHCPELARPGAVVLNPTAFPESRFQFAPIFVAFVFGHEPDRAGLGSRVLASEDAVSLAIDCIDQMLGEM